jgi:hypothetical protein
MIPNNRPWIKYFDPLERSLPTAFVLKYGQPDQYGLILAEFRLSPDPCYQDHNQERGHWRKEPSNYQTEKTA